MFLKGGKRFVLLSFLSLLLICGVQAALAQDKTWRPVTPEELAMRTSKVEADADAEAIFWEVRVDDSDDTDLSLSNYVRVKIFTERGREKFSKVDIPFFKGKKVKDVAARVIKADGSIVELKKEEIFEREIAKANGVKVKAKSFAIPNIEPGVIIEYRYREIFDDSGAIGMHLDFQRDIPVQNLSYYYKPSRKGVPDYQSFNFSDTKFVEDEKGYYLASRRNVPAFKEEPRMPPEYQVRPWILLQALRISATRDTISSISFTIKDPNNPSTYWAAVSKERSGLAKLINLPSKEIKKAAEEIAGTASTPDEKIRKVYEFCQTQIRNVSYDATLTDEQKAKLPGNKTLADVLKHKSGSWNEVDYLFGAMVASLGFDVRPAFTSNRSEMFFDRSMTNDHLLHRGAIAVKVSDNDFKFFSPGSGFLPYGMLMWHDEGVWALLVGENNYYWIKTPMTGVDKTVAKRTGKFKLSEDGTLEGDVRIEYSGQRGYDYKMGNYNESANKREEDLKESIKTQFNTAEVSEISVSNVTDTEKPFVYAFKIRVPNYAQKTGKRLFLQPGFFEYGIEPEFSTATRKQDVYFVYPWAENDDIEIELPKGFALDNADRPDDVGDPQKISSLKIKIGYDKASNSIKYERRFYFGGNGTLLIPVGSYQPLKSLFDTFHKADTHTITIKQS